MKDGRAPAALPDVLLYSQCWEDPAVARAALRIHPGASVLAIAAAGDNVLALLQDDPGLILAIDINPAQTALLELKIEAIRCLDEPAQVGGFLGVRPSHERVETYQRRLRAGLSGDARRYWDAHLDAIRAGVIHAGRFERYLRLFRRIVLPLVPGRSTVRSMLAATDLAEQRRIYLERWDSRSWRLLFRIFFCRSMLRRFGRDPALFENCQVEDVGAHFLARARHALIDIPISHNPYLTYILSGTFMSGERTPDYLRPDTQARLRERVDRIEVRTGGLDEVLRSLPAQSVDAFYLSDIFELSSPAEHAATLREVARVGRPGARLCYWNNLVDRRRPESLAGRLLSDEAESGRLHDLDRAFLYSRLVIEFVGKALV